MANRTTRRTQRNVEQAQSPQPGGPVMTPVYLTDDERALLIRIVSETPVTAPGAQLVILADTFGRILAKLAA